MKQFILFATAVVISTQSFAGLSKNSSQLNALGSAWKTSMHAKQNKNDLTIVYGGADVSSKLSAVEQTTVA